jgi:hypothetical protein
MPQAASGLINRANTGTTPPDDEPGVGAEGRIPPSCDYVSNKITGLVALFYRFSYSSNLTTLAGIDAEDL